MNGGPGGRPDAAFVLEGAGRLITCRRHKNRAGPVGETASSEVPPSSPVHPGGSDEGPVVPGGGHGTVPGSPFRTIFFFHFSNLGPGGLVGPQVLPLPEDTAWQDPPSTLSLLVQNGNAMCFSIHAVRPLGASPEKFFWEVMHVCPVPSGGRSRPRPGEMEGHPAGHPAQRCRGSLSSQSNNAGFI